MDEHKALTSTCGNLSILSFSVNSCCFEIHLTSSYPHTPPRVLCTTVNEFPVCCDGRDLLRYMLPWNKSTSLSSIINAVPEFLSNYKLTDEIGEFQLMSVIPYNVWENKTSMAWFYCCEIDSLNIASSKPRVIVLTHSYFLLLEPCRTSQAGILIFWANLYTIAAIHRSKEDESEFIVYWNSVIGNNIQVFRSKQCRKFCQVLAQNLNKLGSVVQQSYIVDIEDTHEKFKVFDILRKIERCERLMETLVDDEKVNSLIVLYQKAVEYFSAEDDCRYEIYLNKLQRLFTDSRVLSQVFSEIQPRMPKRSRVKSMEVPVPKEFLIGDKRKTAGEGLYSAIYD